MEDESADAIARLTARNRELESRYTHLQRTVEELSGVVVDQGRKIDSLERKLEAFARQLGVLADRDQEPRTLEDDKPPHY